MESGKTESLDSNEIDYNVNYADADEPEQPAEKQSLAVVKKSFKNPQNKQHSEVTRLLRAVPRLAEIFTIVSKVGEGTFSSVFLARIKGSTGPAKDRKYVVKHIIPTSHPDRILTELTCLRHIGGQDNVMGVDLCIREESHVVMVMPYFHHDRFHNYIKTMTVGAARDYMRNLLLALRRVHQFDVIHRDVKPSNFLYNRKEKRYALVDFGLAQKVPSPKRKSRSSSLVAAKQEQITDAPIYDSTPLKRKLRDTIPAAVGLSELNMNTFQNTPPIKGVAPTAAIMATDPGTENEPLPKRARIISPPRVGKGRAAANQRAKIMSNPKRCGCFGRPAVCDVCLARPNQAAPRAGTPGFRAPEVLLKYENQTTAVDMWAAGVIFLSILSGRYPFFKVPDDMTGLAQIMHIHGSEETKVVAKKLGKNLVSSISLPRMDLEQVCRNLRANQTTAARGNSPGRRRLKNSPGRSKQRSPKGQGSPRGRGSPRSRKADAENLENSESVNTGTDKPPRGEFPSSAFDLLGRLLDLDPSSRITAEDALEHPFIAGES